MNPGPHSAPPSAPAPGASRGWLLPMAALVGLAVVALELAYARWPVPPGDDPADWIQRSYAWVGLPSPPFDAVGSPFLYPPVLFPPLGIVHRITGNAMVTADVFGGLLLLFYGATSVHLARRFLREGPSQLFLVGLLTLNGTMLQMLFWGGYPNFLALAFVNELLVALLAFVRGLRTVDGVVAFGWLSVIYLTHTLTFVLVGVGVAATGVLLLVQHRGRFLGVVRSRGLWVGGGVLAGTVALYSLAIRLAHIETPGYLGSNPTAYQLDNLGTLFRPLALGPMFLPPGPVVTLGATGTAVLLSALAVAVLVGLFLVDRRARATDDRRTIAAGVALAVLVVPVVGWAAGVDTDYSRFVYFLVLPASLALALGADALLARYLAMPWPEPSAAPPAGASPRRTGRARQARLFDGALGVAVVLGVLFATVAAPTLAANEQVDAGPSHDAAFLRALRFLAADATPGSVLTVPGAVRWVEAASGRGGFDVGPTWLLFEPWQIVNAQESYWALNSQYAVTNNVDVLAFSGGYQGVDRSPIIAAPVYASYLSGVAAPLVNLPTGGIWVNVTGSGSSGWTPAGAFARPLLAPDAANGSLVLTFRAPSFVLTEVARPDPSGGAAVTFRVVPLANASIAGVSLQLGMPSNAVAMLHAPSPRGAVVAADGTVAWTVSESIGPNPGPTTVVTAISPRPAPATMVVSGAAAPNAANLTFLRPPSATEYDVALGFSTTGGWNPAVRLPPILSTAEFLATHQIRFLLVPQKPSYAYTMAYYENLYGFRPLFQDGEWEVLGS